MEQPVDNPSRVRLVSLSQTSLTVPIVNINTDEKDEIQIMPGGKPYLAAGFVVEPSFLTRNALTLLVVAS
jgi:hypothetical protein